MVQERIVETTPAEGQVSPATTTVVVEKRRAGGITIFIAIFLVLAALIGAYLFSEMKGSEMAKDNAVAQAADSVGKAADQVGSAATQAGAAAEDAVDKIDDR